MAESSKSNARKASDSGSNGQTSKRRKVNHACLYCRRSHMHCDENRPCARCIKRDIGHLCHDELKPPAPPNNGSSSATKPEPTSASSLPLPTSTFPSLTGQPFSLPGVKVDSVGTYGSGAGSTPFLAGPPSGGMVPSNTWPLVSADPTSLFQADASGNLPGQNGEFSVLSQFLENLDANSWFNNGGMGPGTSVASNPSSSLMTTSPLTQTSGGTPQQQQPQQTGSSVSLTTPLFNTNTSFPPATPQPQPMQQVSSSQTQVPAEQQQHEHEHVDPLPPQTKTERFLLTAADQESGTRDERLKAVIRAKYEAGLLKPYNYVKGYARLSRWMERNVSSESRQAILQPISVLRPRFRGIAQNLKDIDLVYVEEAFERLLLDYDRVFSAMGIPACLWRRTGEIYKANKSFADLVGIDISKFRDGRLCIYELMSENSAVNYWEKYGHVAFDSKQKAVLTSCVLRYKPDLPALQTPALAYANLTNPRASEEESAVNCCFSFTIRRDIWGIPSMIVGNFIKC